MKFHLKKIYIFTLSLLIFLGLITGTFFYIRHQILIPLSPDSKISKTFLIERGLGLKEIAKNLEKEKLIKDDFYFIIYVWSKNQMDKLQAGKYEIGPAMNVPQIAEKLIKGEVILEEVQITIPEGFRISQIEERLADKGFKFQISSFKIKDFKKDYDFLADVLDEANLEGFLFPDTYRFSKDFEAEEIITKMLDNFARLLTEDLREEIFSQKKTIYDIIRMASIIEKEVADPKERRIVSGIFWKRLGVGQALESCATIAYILDKDKWRYSFEETRIKSPYNTYLNLGLPPAPISNPGLQSIRAAIYPVESSFNYFLSDPETGQTIFSKTIDEHNRNKLKYFK